MVSYTSTVQAVADAATPGLHKPSVSLQNARGLRSIINTDRRFESKIIEHAVRLKSVSVTGG